MKPHIKLPCTILATALAAVLQLAAIAAVPVAWTNSPGLPPYPLKPVPHGVPVDFRVTLKGYTEPLIAPGADLHLWYQTNGMGKLWWPAPAALEGDTITASFGPAQDTGADRVSLFFGAPSNVFASAVLRLTHAPGFAPASLPLPVPVLDFSAVELRNLFALTNGWSFGSTPGDYETVSKKTAAIELEDEHWRFHGVADNAMYAQTASELSSDGGLHRLYFDDVEGRWISNEYYGLDNHGLAYLDDIPSPPDLTPYATKTALESAADLARARHDYRWAAKQGVLYRIDFDADGYQYLTPVTNVNALAEGNEHILIHLEEQRHGNAD